MSTQHLLVTKNADGGLDVTTAYPKPERVDIRVRQRMSGLVYECDRNIFSRLIYGKWDRPDEGANNYDLDWNRLEAADLAVAARMAVDGEKDTQIGHSLWDQRMEKQFREEEAAKPLTEREQAIERLFAPCQLDEQHSPTTTLPMHCQGDDGTITMQMTYEPIKT